MKYLLALLTVLLSGAVVWRLSKQHQTLQLAQVPAVAPVVRVVSPVQAPKLQKVSFPATVKPVNQATLFARSNGFVRSLAVDLGDRVKKGQVLAQLDAPELAASLTQAKARFAQAKASVELTAAQHERTQTLRRSGNLSDQEVDASALRLTATTSEVATAAAEVERLSALLSYLTVRAPFDGTITRRYVDEGALAALERTALFDLASTDSLQVDVDVPQWCAGQIVVGLPAEVTSGSSVVQATVTRTAGALDPNLRTLKTELQLPATAKLVPGSYVRVSFSVPRSDEPWLLPGAALAIRSGATQVMLVSAEQKIHAVPVRIARELGREVEVLGEIVGTSQVVLYPSATLNEGDVVKTVSGQAGAP